MGVNRDIALCVPLLQAVWKYLVQEWPKRYPTGPKIILVETFRAAAVQRAYYAQGREKLAIVNRLRQGAGLAAISEVENRKKITFKKPGGSKHELSPAKAFDIGFVAGGKMDYSPGHYDQAAAIIREAFPAITWGADWNKNGKTTDETFVDRPHFEV